MNHPKPARLDPFHELSRLQESLTRMLDEGFFRRPGESALSAWAPDVDIYETADELVLQADMPGLSERDIDIRVENNTFGALEGYHALKVSVPASVEPCVGCTIAGNQAVKPIAVNVERPGSSIAVTGNRMSSADLYAPGWCDHGLYGVAWDANVFERRPSCGTNALT